MKAAGFEQEGNRLYIKPTRIGMDAEYKTHSVRSLRPTEIKSATLNGKKLKKSDILNIEINRIYFDIQDKSFHTQRAMAETSPMREDLSKIFEINSKAYIESILKK